MPLGDHAVHHQQQLAAATDGEGLHRGDPGLLGGVLEAALPVVGEPETALDLAQQAHFAGDHEVHERDPPVVEVGEVDAGVEDPPARVSWVVDD